MDPIKPAVEIPVQPAAPVQPAVETSVPPAAPVPPVDYAKIIADKDAELAQLAIDRDNYKKGLLIAKGKLPAEEISVVEKPEIATLIQEEVQKALFSNKEAQLKAEKDLLLQQALNENKELKTALASKQGMSISGMGTSADNIMTTEQFFTAEQLAYFKARGLDPNKVKSNYLNKVK